MIEIKRHNVTDVVEQVREGGLCAYRVEGNGVAPDRIGVKVDSHAPIVAQTDFVAWAKAVEKHMTSRGDMKLEADLAVDSKSAEKQRAEVAEARAEAIRERQFMRFAEKEGDAKMSLGKTFVSVSAGGQSWEFPAKDPAKMAVELKAAYPFLEEPEPEPEPVKPFNE